MSKVRVLVGTKKGAFILTADGARKNWEVSGPHDEGEKRGMGVQSLAPCQRDALASDASDLSAPVLKTIWGGL